MENSIFKNLMNIRDNLGKTTKIILGIIPIILILLTWFFLTKGANPEDRIISILILPSPMEVLLSFKSLWFEAELSRSVLASGMRVLGGFTVALIIVFPLGILMGSITKIRALFDPLVTFAAYMPIPALVPLTMSLFGIGESQKILFLSLSFIIYLLPLFIKAIEDVDDIYLQTAYTMGATKWHIIKDILFGIAFPKIFHAMRLGFGVGWTYIILVEMVAAERGLGHIILMAQRRGPKGHIYLVLGVIVLLAFITDKLWVKLGRKLFPYQQED